jgi:Na+/phosphate symporter
MTEAYYDMPDDDFDFGFTTVSEEVFTQAEESLDLAEQRLKKLEKMYNLILPLLNNLAKDADKNAYIHWPNRKEKIEEFNKKLLSLLG